MLGSTVQWDYLYSHCCITITTIYLSYWTKTQHSILHFSLASIQHHSISHLLKFDAICVIGWLIQYLFFFNLVISLSTMFSRFIFALACNSYLRWCDTILHVDTIFVQQWMAKYMSCFHYLAMFSNGQINSDFSECMNSIRLGRDQEIKLLYYMLIQVLPCCFPQGWYHSQSHPSMIIHSSIPTT